MSRITLRCIALLGALVSASCGSDLPRQPDVYVIVMDTVRRDFMGFAGYERPTTPVLDAFAETATEYPRAKATAPWTLPSHASLFTGTYPFEHGARGYWDPKWTVEALQRMNNRGNVRGLSAERLTLAEWLSARGYRTGAVVANDVFLGERYGVDRGFDHYDLGIERAPRINERALRWLDEADDRPTFLFLNYMDAHKPYNDAPVERLGEQPPYEKPLVHRVQRAIHSQSPKLDRSELAQIVRWYELGIANLDAAIGDLIAELEARGRLENSLIVITSDHGEYFGEYDLFGHSKDVHEEVLAIPLIVREPGQAEGRIDDRLIGLAQIPALIAEIVAPEATELPFANAHPERVLGELHGSRMKDLKEPWGPRLMRSRFALYEGPWKLIHSTDGQHELHDLRVGERDNLALDQRSTVLDLQKQLMRLVERGSESLASLDADTLTAEEQELSPEEVERLESLGYH